MLKRTDNSDTTTSETKLRKKSPDDLLQRSKKLRTGELEKSLLNSLSNMLESKTTQQREKQCCL